MNVGNVHHNHNNRVTFTYTPTSVTSASSTVNDSTTHITNQQQIKSSISYRLNLSKFSSPNRRLLHQKHDDVTTSPNTPITIATVATTSHSHSHNVAQSTTTTTRSSCPSVRVSAAPTAPRLGAAETICSHATCTTASCCELLIGPLFYYVLLIVIFTLCLYLCLDGQPPRVLALERFVAKFANNSATISTSNTIFSSSSSSFSSISFSSTALSDSKASTKSTTFATPDVNQKIISSLLNRHPRSTSSSSLSSSSATPRSDNLKSSSSLPPFTILALLPDENAPLISRALRDGQSKWEISGHQSEYWLKMQQNQHNQTMASTSSTMKDNVPLVLRASDIQLNIYSEPTNNDTERILSSTCEWIRVHKPALVLSLLDHQRAFYAAMVAQSAGIPFVSMTQHYQNEIVDPIMMADGATATTKSTESTQQSSTTKSSKKWKQKTRHEEYWMPSPYRLSLDPPIQTLADATFQLLRAQYWFDALLIIDESIVSDLFARRLLSLCDSFRQRYEKKNAAKKYKEQKEIKQKLNHFQSDHHQNEYYSTSKRKRRKTAKNRIPDNSYTETFTWMRLKRSTVKRGKMLADTLLLPETNFQRKQNILQSDTDRSIFTNHEQELGQKKFSQTKRKQHLTAEDIRNSKAGLLMSIWKSLMVVRISQSLQQKEFYLRMAEIQNTHRRVVLVHCDQSTTEHVLKTARELDLFNGEKIWILLDGLLGPEEKFDMKPLPVPSSSSTDSLPNGMLALQNRHRLIYDPELLDSIVELMGKAALNSYQKRLFEKHGINIGKQANNNNQNSPFHRSTQYYSSSSFLNTDRAFHSPPSSSSSSSISTKPEEMNLLLRRNSTQSTSSLPKTPFNQPPEKLVANPAASVFNVEQGSSGPDAMTPIGASDSTKAASSTCLTSLLLMNYTNEQVEFRFDILRELRKLLNPVLARYRYKSRCSQWSPSQSSSVRQQQQTSRINKRRYRQQQNDDHGNNTGLKNQIKTNEDHVSNWTSSTAKTITANQQSSIFASSADDRQESWHPTTDKSSSSENGAIYDDDFMVVDDGQFQQNNRLRRSNMKKKKRKNIVRHRQQPFYSLDNQNLIYQQNAQQQDDLDNDDDYYYDDDNDDQDFHRPYDDDFWSKEDGHSDDDNTAIFQMEMYRSIVPHFDILNLVPIYDSSGEDDGPRSEWRTVGNITNDQTNVNTIMYIGSDQLPNYVMYAAAGAHAGGMGSVPVMTINNIDQSEQQQKGDSDNFMKPYGQDGLSSTLPFIPQRPPLMHMTSSGKHRFRVVTNIAPPFVIESTKLDNNTCLIGDFCLKVLTNVRDDLIAIFTDFRSQRRQLEGKSYHVHCCAGIAIDLLNAVARDLHFDYDLYLVADGLFGIKKDGKWDGVTADLVNDVAHLSFTAFSTTSSRVQAIDYSVPFFYSGVSCLSSVSSYSDVRLLAFLIPFSYELWAAIFASLVATAIAAAIYEWFSPFGLNPWGRQRTKNFSLASALWVMCSLLFSHLVAFKAPKSWPNKVLINVWGAFSVIFLATYTANIAAHFAGFLLPEVNDFHDSSLMQQRTGTARSSASEGYLMEKYTELWHHIQRYKMDSFDAGLESLRNDKLDVLIGDTAILDYYRANDPGCNLRLLGDSIFDDAYAVGMQKGFPFRESISNLILKYNEYGFLDQLHRKWYGRVHCLESTSLSKPEPLTVRGVAGVFLMLTIGILVGIIILFAEHFAFKYMLPGLRKKPKDCFWKSPNLMFFSQKLYRFINTVELVSPHHSAKEIITNLREGQIASLFQKSVKRKAKEEARRRKSKSQFFEMIQEVRKVVHLQQTERSMQQDDDEAAAAANDDDDDLESDIDEEAAINTNANIRATRPSFSTTMSSKDELIEMEICQNRVSAIRFREPNDTNNSNNVSVVHHVENPLLDSQQRCRMFKQTKPIGSSCLKASSTDSSIAGSKQNIPRKFFSKQQPQHKYYNNSSTDSGKEDNMIHLDPIATKPSIQTKVTRRRRKSNSKPTSQDDDDDDGALKCRRMKLMQSHRSSTSFSLENIFFEGLLSEGISDPDEKKRHSQRRRILSFEDLPAIKKELSESSQEDYIGPVGSGPTSGAIMIESEQYGQYTQKTKPTSSHGPRLKTIRQIAGSTDAASVHQSDRYAKLSRTDILNLWNSSERELLSRLQSIMEQKRALEEKVALLQQMLMKPP